MLFRSELGAALGRAATVVDTAETRDRIELIQQDLFVLGAELATPPPAEGRPRPKTPDLPDGRVEEMERWIDASDGELPELRAFVLSGGSAGAAALHVARTVCRRAERAVVRLAEEDPVDDVVLRYLNRLSDLLFTWARLENHRSGVGDVEWRPSETQE